MNWRLTSELIAYFLPGKKVVYLAALEKKQFQANVIKLIGNDVTYEELRLYENQFELKFQEGGEQILRVMIRSSEFPSEEDWYEVANFYQPSLWNLLESHILKNGCFEEGLMFEVGFNDTLPYVTFIEPKMKDFKSYFEEMKRYMNCDMCKKTTKWIPGHRYDSMTETIFYLASAKSRKELPSNSDFISDFDKLGDVIIYTNLLNDEKTVSEVLKGRCFGNNPEDLKVLYKPKSMVDSGEALANDFSGNIQDYWTEIYDNAYTRGYDIKSVLDIFSITNSKDTDKENLPITELEDLTVDSMLDIIIDCWNINNLRKDLNIGDNIEDNDNIDRLGKLLTSSYIKDENFLKNIYYQGLYKYLGINLQELAERAINKFRDLDIDHNFDSHVKYQRYWSNLVRFNSEANSSRQRVKSSKYKLDVVTLKDLYGESELKDVLVELTNKVRESFGIGATEYSLINIGTRKDPQEYIMCRLTLDDLIKFKKGTSNMSETLKNEITRFHFVSVQITVDKEGDIS